MEGDEKWKNRGWHVSITNHLVEKLRLGPFSEDRSNHFPRGNFFRNVPPLPLSLPINRFRGSRWTKSTKWRQQTLAPLRRFTVKRNRNSVKDSFSFGDFNYNPPNFQELKGISFTLGKLNSFRDSPRYFNELAEFLWKRKYIVSSNYCSCRCFVDLNVRINIFFFSVFRVIYFLE